MDNTYPYKKKKFFFSRNILKELVVASTNVKNVQTMVIAAKASKILGWMNIIINHKADMLGFKTLQLF